MKPLTIEELKALEVGDWVWVKVLKPDYPRRDYDGEYCRITPPYIDGLCYGWQGSGGFYKYEDYGICWLAYKNKEQAEAKGEIVALPCKPNDIVYYVTEVDDGNDIYLTIVNGVVDCFNIETGCKEFLARYDGGLTYWHNFLEFGKEVFTNKSEAERRLAELKGEEK